MNRLLKARNAEGAALATPSLRLAQNFQIPI
jgi:hypothetical protein